MKEVQVTLTFQVRATRDLTPSEALQCVNNIVADNRYGGEDVSRLHQLSWPDGFYHGGPISAEVVDATSFDYIVPAPTEEEVQEALDKLAAEKAEREAEKAAKEAQAAAETATSNTTEGN
jgi:hypothetical protein